MKKSTKGMLETLIAGYLVLKTGTILVIPSNLFEKTDCLERAHICVTQDASTYEPINTRNHFLSSERSYFSEENNKPIETRRPMYAIIREDYLWDSYHKPNS